MKKHFGAAILCLAFASTMARSDDTGSDLETNWSFGLQAAPLAYGLSLRRHFSNDWQLQGVLRPDSDDVAFGVRALRTSTQKQFWRSYFFGGLAVGEEDLSYYYFDENNSPVNPQSRKTVATIGLGVEWAWTGKNPSAPPLAWSLELGLGYSMRDYNGNATDFSGNSFSDSSEAFLALGAGIHYLFE